MCFNADLTYEPLGADIAIQVIMVVLAFPQLVGHAVSTTTTGGGGGAARQRRRGQFPAAGVEITPWVTRGCKSSRATDLLISLRLSFFPPVEERMSDHYSGRANQQAFVLGLGRSAENIPDDPLADRVTSNEARLMSCC